jgi:hypothetical protein
MILRLPEWPPSRGRILDVGQRIRIADLHTAATLPFRITIAEEHYRDFVHSDELATRWSRKRCFSHMPPRREPSSGWSSKGRYEIVMGACPLKAV